jgi:hypothetical protein
LLRLASFTYPDEVEDAGINLEVDSGRATNGWYVGANFGAGVWDIIESPKFTPLLPKINADIRKWWEDQSGRKEWAQYTTVFDGKDGLTLQVYQPGSKGLWIAGSRNSCNSCGLYQLVDHNTDSWRDAIAHVLSLSIVLKYCRELCQ